MKFLITYLFLVTLINSAVSALHVAETINVLRSEAFFIPIERTWFSKFSIEDDLEFSAYLLDMPDLPNWMFCQNSNTSQDAFLYGSAEQLGAIHIDIVALNRKNFQTDLKVLKINVEPRSNISEFEVEMKFLNLDIEDMFKAKRLERLVKIFRSNLWQESPVLYVTKVVSSSDVGGRLPLNPKEKEGVVVRIGGTSAFSRTLLDLDREVQPLRNRSPCPRNYKRTSVEHLFRPRNFIADWCSFRLLSKTVPDTSGTGQKSHQPPFSPISLASENYNPQSIKHPRRDFLFDFIVSIVIPSTVVSVLSTVLTCIMCFNRDGNKKKMDEDDGLLVGLNHFRSTLNQVQKANVEGDNYSCSAYASRSLSLPASRRGSPASTLKVSAAAASSTVNKK